MRISVIVPVYNGEKYIADAIGDLINQTYRDIEILVVDDGSIDATGRICDHLATGDDRIKVIHKGNGGLSSAKNCGLAAATGDYIGFLDADDRIDPEMYEIMIGLAQKHGSDLVACGFQTEYADHISLTQHHEEIPVVIAFTGKKECLMSLETSENCIYGYSWNKLYKQSRIGGLRFAEDIKICEDVVFNYHFLRNAESVHYISTPLYHYRYVTTSLTKASKASIYLHPLERIHELIDWVSDIVPESRTALIHRYLFWNTKACEAMIRDYDKRIYNQIRTNIGKYSEFIGTFPLRRRILVSAAAKSWFTYKFCGEVNILLKVCYIDIVSRYYKAGKKDRNG